jgi:hypothetical protein
MGAIRASAATLYPNAMRQLRDSGIDTSSLESAVIEIPGDAEVTEVTHSGGTDAALLLREVSVYLLDYIVYPSLHATIAHVLWIAHTHLMDVWESTPRIAFLSPESGSGKTRALELTENLVPRPCIAINASSAFVFRKIADKDGPPTLLWDEIDTIFGPKAREHEDIRGVLNAGHRRGAMAGRCVIRGKEVLTEELPAYCAAALAGLGQLPDTILTRSVIVRMRRRMPEETVQPYRRRTDAAEGHSLRDRLAAWADEIRPKLTRTWPQLPEGVTDRDADCWEPLIAIADAAGGEWPQIARVAAVTLVTERAERNPSLGIRLLADLRQVFGDTEALRTSVILERLLELEESPWGDLKGKPLDARKLSQLLRPFDVERTTFREGTGTAKGYTRASLSDPWKRYLGASANSVTAETAATAKVVNGGARGHASPCRVGGRT